jgi:hypothetical protein
MKGRKTRPFVFFDARESRRPDSNRGPSLRPTIRPPADGERRDQLARALARIARIPLY